MSPGSSELCIRTRFSSLQSGSVFTCRLFPLVRTKKQSPVCFSKTKGDIQWVTWTDSGQLRSPLLRRPHGSLEEKSKLQSLFWWQIWSHVALHCSGQLYLSSLVVVWSLQRHFRIQASIKTALHLMRAARIRWGGDNRSCSRTMKELLGLPGDDWGRVRTFITF